MNIRFILILHLFRIQFRDRCFRSLDTLLSFNFKGLGNLIIVLVITIQIMPYLSILGFFLCCHIIYNMGDNSKIVCSKLSISKCFKPLYSLFWKCKIKEIIHYKNKFVKNAVWNLMIKYVMISSLRKTVDG